jgi:hypothetical protein
MRPSAAHDAASIGLASPKQLDRVILSKATSRQRRMLSG